MTYPVKARCLPTAADDGYYDISVGTVDTANTGGAPMLEIGDHLFARWPSVDVAKGRKILSAVIQLKTAHLKNQAGATYQATIEDSINPAPASAGSLGRTYLSASPKVAHEGEPGFVQLDVTNQVQQMVNRSDWVSGGPMFGNVILTDPHPTVSTVPNYALWDGYGGNGVRLYILHAPADWVEPEGPWIRDSLSTLSDGSPYDWLYGENVREAPFHEPGDLLVCWIGPSAPDVPTVAGLENHATVVQLNEPALDSSYRNGHLTVVAGKIPTKKHDFSVSITATGTTEGSYNLISIANVKDIPQPWTVASARANGVKGTSWSTPALPITQAPSALLGIARTRYANANAHFEGPTGLDDKVISALYDEPQELFSRITGGSTATYMGTQYSSEVWSAVIMEFIPETPVIPPDPTEPPPANPRAGDFLAFF
jgi:hypothetical protein